MFHSYQHFKSRTLQVVLPKVTPRGGELSQRLLLSSYVDSDDWRSTVPRIPARLRDRLVSKVFSSPTIKQTRRGHTNTVGTFMAACIRTPLDRFPNLFAFTIFPFVRIQAMLFLLHRNWGVKKPQKHDVLCVSLWKWQCGRKRLTNTLSLWQAYRLWRLLAFHPGSWSYIPKPKNFTTRIIELTS